MISAHKTNDEFVELDPEDVRAKAIFSQSNSPAVSGRYRHIQTTELVEAARKAGWETFNYGVKRRNKKSIEKGLSIDSAAHFVALKPLSMSEANILDGGSRNYSRAYPTLMLYNDHGGLGSASAEIGLYEFLCSNAAIILAEGLGATRWRHSGASASLNKIQEDLTNLLDYAPWIMNVRKFLSHLTVTNQQAYNLAERAISLRWDENKYVVEPADLIRPRYKEQTDLSAYNIFQSVQRSLIQNNDFQVTALQQKPNRRPERRVRTIKNFSEERRINKGLWIHTLAWLSDMGYDIPSA